ncbi:YciI family protein [Coralliovum pocilloporae]|uniref:YciI family protein n=1 Tax=Coralliovum pocilloporae TaxID=3066369 RepID=UPI003306C678
MHFVVTALDKDGALDVRKANRDAHLAFLADNAVKVKIAGPLLEGDNMIGSLLIVEADSREAVEAMLAEDPYAKADLFQDVTIRSWKWAVDNQ